MNVRLYIWQRATAAIMAPLAWAAFYGLFVLAVSIHASIGVRNVLSEWSPLSERRTDACAVFIGIVLAGLGLRAVAAVVMP